MGICKASSPVEETILVSSTYQSADLKSLFRVATGWAREVRLGLRSRFADGLSCTAWSRYFNLFDLVKTVLTRLLMAQLGLFRAYW